MELFREFGAPLGFLILVAFSIHQYIQLRLVNQRSSDALAARDRELDLKLREQSQKMNIDGLQRERELTAVVLRLTEGNAELKQQQMSNMSAIRDLQEASEKQGSKIAELNEKLETSEAALQQAVRERDEAVQQRDEAYLQRDIEIAKNLELQEKVRELELRIERVEKENVQLHAQLEEIRGKNSSAEELKSGRGE